MIIRIGAMEISVKVSRIRRVPFISPFPPSLMLMESILEGSSLLADTVIELTIHNMPTVTSRHITFFNVIAVSIDFSLFTFSLLFFR